MFCSHCGAEASGNFCSSCGSPFADRAGTETSSAPADWSDEIRYEELLVTEGSATAIEAATQIKGQLFDWGKSSRYLDGLFNDLEQTPALM